MQTVTYVIDINIFNKWKKELNGSIFHQENNNKVIVKQACPNKNIKNLLKQISI